MTELHERRVTRLAERAGLALTRVSYETGGWVYQLVGAEARLPVFPGGGQAGATLVEIEDWLSLPSE